MKIGISTFVTDDGIDSVSLAGAIEERGFDSLVIAEHTNIPASRETPYPMGGELPDIYYRTLDPFVTLAAAAAVTSRIELFTGIALLIQRDPIITAKEAASIDLISGGRFTFGVGAGCFADLLAGTTCKVTTLNAQHDPNFGGINPEPVVQNYACSAAFLRKHPHDICLVTDGDADRIGGMDGRGRPLSTHQIICLLLQHFLQLVGRALAVLPGLHDHAAESLVDGRDTRQLEGRIELGKLLRCVEHQFGVPLHLLKSRVRRSNDLRENDTLVFLRGQLRLGCHEQIYSPCEQQHAQHHQHLPGLQPTGQDTQVSGAQPAEDAVYEVNKAPFFLLGAEYIRAHHG